MNDDSSTSNEICVHSWDVDEADKRWSTCGVEGTQCKGDTA